MRKSELHCQDQTQRDVRRDNRHRDHGVLMGSVISSTTPMEQLLSIIHGVSLSLLSESVLTIHAASSIDRRAAAAFRTLDAPHVARIGACHRTRRDRKRHGQYMRPALRLVHLAASFNKHRKAVDGAWCVQL